MAGQPQLDIRKGGNGRRASDVIKSRTTKWSPEHPQGAVKHGGGKGSNPGNT